MDSLPHVGLPRSALLCWCALSRAYPHPPESQEASPGQPQALLRAWFRPDSWATWASRSVFVRLSFFVCKVGLTRCFTWLLGTTGENQHMPWGHCVWEGQGEPCRRRRERPALCCPGRDLVCE